MRFYRDCGKEITTDNGFIETGWFCKVVGENIKLVVYLNPKTLDESYFHSCVYINRK